MKLLKYVMTNDSGLAPNPFFGICSLAICTPNHRNAQLEPGDWVVGHSCKASGRRLVYAMRLTNVLKMPIYFANYPEKRPDPNGSYEQQCGDNIYNRVGDHWTRLPSTEHNCIKCFEQDINRKVYIAEGKSNFWYFGAKSQLCEVGGFADRFPWLIQERQGFTYVRDAIRITAFSDWLIRLDPNGGKIGEPRDMVPVTAEQYLTSIDPTEQWIGSDAIAPAMITSAGNLERQSIHIPQDGNGCHS